MRTFLARPVVTDLTVSFSASNSTPIQPPAHQPRSRVWHRIEKELHLHKSTQRAWLYVALVDEEELAADDLLVTDIRVAELCPESSPGRLWESRPGGIWLRKRVFSGEIHQFITAVNVLFGKDAVDPRPEWALMRCSIRLDGPPGIPVARLSVLYGRADPTAVRPATLRTGKDGRFKILQISDTHMVTGVGVCKDAIDADGKDLPESEADPLTVNFIGKNLDIEKPDLVIFTGDQLHHDISDSQTALYKVTAPIIKRAIPFAAVFGNHDSEGVHASSRRAQMMILRDLPYSLCELGPEMVDGVGNFVLQILGPTPSTAPSSTLFLLDSHSEMPNKTRNPDYHPIQQSQIDWFTNTSKALRSIQASRDNALQHHLSLVFQHIPLPEFGDHHLRLYSGHRGEPSEAPSLNTHFYDALVQESVAALGCGHDHVNDFCALLPSRPPRDSDAPVQSGPWLCYGGASGFGGYCSYGKNRYHRRVRVWELEPNAGSLKTWKRVEYAMERVDEQLLIDNGQVIDPDANAPQHF